MKPRKTKPTQPAPAAGDGFTPPATPDASPIVPWLKLDPSSRVKVIVCSKTWLGAQTHWAEGRMKIHTTPTCRYCKTGSPIRFYFFLHVCAVNYHREYVVQLSAGNMAPLIRAKDEYSTLRGCAVELARRGKNANSPTTISFTSPPFEAKELPPALDIRFKLQHATDWNDTGLTDHDQPKEADA